MSVANQYELTHELFMLWQMRYKMGPLNTYPEKDRALVYAREIELCQLLGYKHNMFVPGRLGHTDWCLHVVFNSQKCNCGAAI